MKNNYFFKKLILLLITLMCLSGQAVNAEHEPIPNELFIYTPHEMLSFDIKSYLEEKAPHLAEYAEIISHWSGRSTVSPKIIITLIEMKTSLVSNTQWNDAALQNPLGDLSNETGFSEQIEDVTSRLSRFYYQNREQQFPAQLALEHILINQDGAAQYEPADFRNVYYQLFPQPITKPSKQKADFPSGATVDFPPDNFLQFPFPVGESWAAGGTHGNTSGTNIFSAMDFWKIYKDWGADLSNYWVSASTGGTAIRHSSCSIEVIDDSGWSTSYYHLDNVQITTGQSVTRNQPLANYANNINQALCNGGSSSGPHVHFSLKKDGEYKDLDGVKISQHTIHGGRSPYDTDQNYFWIVRPDGSKYYAFYTDLYNPGVITTSPPKPASPALTPILFLLLR